MSLSPAPVSPEPVPQRRPLGWRDYLGYPRVLLTLILCGAFFIAHIALAIYMWIAER